MYEYHCLNPIAEIGLEQFGEKYAATENMDEADAVLVRSASMHDMELGDSLKAIARAGAGVNNIPSGKCAEKGIVVFNTPGANANGVKELVLAGMLLSARDIIGGINWVEEHEEDGDLAKATEKAKKAFAGTELAGKKLGVIGLGAIGVLVANAATHLGMEVYGYDPYVSVDAAWKLSRNIHHAKSVDELYKECVLSDRSCSGTGRYKRNDQQRRHQSYEKRRCYFEFCQRCSCESGRHRRRACIGESALLRNGLPDKRDSRCQRRDRDSASWCIYRGVGR